MYNVGRDNALPDELYALIRGHARVDVRFCRAFAQIYATDRGRVICCVCGRKTYVARYELRAYRTHVRRMNTATNVDECNNKGELLSKKK